MFSLRDDITYFEVSALTGENVDNLFDKIASALSVQPVSNSQKDGRLSFDFNEKRNSVLKEGGETISLNEPSSKKESSCCASC